jgi:hypothetical protein
MAGMGRESSISVDAGPLSFRQVADAVEEAGLPWLVYAQSRGRYVPENLEGFETYHLALVLDEEEERWYLAHFGEGLPEGSQFLRESDGGDDIWTLQGAGTSPAKKEVVRVLAAAGICNGGQVYDRLVALARGKVDALLAGGFEDSKLATCLLTLARSYRITCRARGTSVRVKPAAALDGESQPREQEAAPQAFLPALEPAETARMEGAPMLPRLRLASELLPAPPTPEDTFRWQLVSHAAGVEGWSGCIAWNAPENAQCAAYWIRKAPSAGRGGWTGLSVDPGFLSFACGHN